ncbi:MAG: CDP-alcohol phosphatidyltransferase family protein [Planctomycetota bacterium]|nr:CDP-alcohol phosphatidyltransferase family protein [Planctomycetota bacterium]MDA1113656.1 CDP-alcohol phosphatidyltransferase family protein [Planctomycetota bacterium]
MDQEHRPPTVLSPQNIVTLGNLACGVGAILLAVAAVVENNPHRLYEGALWLVLATFLDAIDGKLARITGTASPLGAQLDSLADAVTFGVAPGVVAVTLVRMMGPELGIAIHPRLLVVAPVVYSCCAILRLARFNVDSEHEDLTKDHATFVGLPSPGAAGPPIALVLFYFGIADTKLFNVSAGAIAWVNAAIIYLIPILLLLLALLMVARVPYPHFFAWMMRSTRPVSTLAKFVVVFGILFLEPELALLAMSLIYVFIPMLRDLPAMARSIPPLLHKKKR